MSNFDRFLSDSEIEAIREGRASGYNLLERYALDEDCAADWYGSEYPPSNAYEVAGEYNSVLGEWLENNLEATEEELEQESVRLFDQMTDDRKIGDVEFEFEDEAEEEDEE